MPSRSRGAKSPGFGGGAGWTGTACRVAARLPPCQLFWTPTPDPGIPAETVRLPVVLAETPAPRGPTRRLAPRWLAVSLTPGPSLTLFRIRNPTLRPPLIAASNLTGRGPRWQALANARPRSSRTGRRRGSGARTDSAAPQARPPRASRARCRRRPSDHRACSCVLRECLPRSKRRATGPQQRKGGSMYIGVGAAILIVILLIVFVF
jgi:hypothetical protein